MPSRQAHAMALAGEGLCRSGRVWYGSKGQVADLP